MDRITIPTADAVVRITERGLDAECVCEPETDAVGCARAWEEVVPCDCPCHGAPVAVTSAVVHDLAGLPLAGRALWIRIPTPRGLLMVPQATVDAIEGAR